MVQKFPIVPGRRAWIDKVNPYDLPEGCPDGIAVTIISHEKEERLVTVRADDGRIWRLWHVHLDTGWNYYFEGKRYHESHPKAREYMQKCLADIQERKEHPSFPGSKQRNIDAIVKILNRVDVWTKGQTDPQPPSPASAPG